jgi:hypothetical protein
MDFPRLSAKQYVTNAVLIGAGLIGVVQPFELRISRAGGTQDLGPISTFIGLACVACALIPLVAKRWRVGLVLLMLAATFAGRLAGGAVWRAQNPGLEFEQGKGSEDWNRKLMRQEKPYLDWGFALGAASVPIAAAACSAIGMRPADAHSPSP